MSRRIDANDRAHSTAASAPFDGDSDDNVDHNDRDFGFTDIEAAEEDHPFINDTSTSPSSISSPWHRLRRGTQWPPRWAKWRRHSRGSAAVSGPSSGPTLRLPQVQSPRAVIFTLSCLKFVILGSGLLVMMPMVRLLEDAFCHQHYGKDPAEPIPEMECKIDEVQTRLAYLGGIGAVIASVITLITTFPYSILADKVGRKPALLLSWIGIMLAFGWGPAVLWFSAQPNIFLLLFGSVFLFIGGGIPTTINVMFSMASDVGSSSTTAAESESDRASNFLYLSIGGVAAGLVAPLLSGVLMEHSSPWVPIGIVFALGPFILAAMFILPETLRIRVEAETHSEDETETDDGQPSLPTILRRHLRSGLADLTAGFKVLRNRNISLCLVCFLATQPLWVANSSTLPQYVSTYFGWTLAQTSYLLAPFGILHLVLLAVVLPRLSARLVDKDRRFFLRGSRPLSTFSKDLFLTRVSYALLALGALVQALGGSAAVFLSGMVVATLGSAAGTLARAVVTEFVDPSVTSRLYAVLGIVDMAGGALIGGPALAWLFSTGMKHGGLMRGLPWFYISVLCAAALGTVMLVREPRKPKSQVDVGGGEGVDGMGYLSAGED